MDKNAFSAFGIRNDGPLAFHPSPLPLQMIALNKIATLLWRHKINDLNPWDNMTTWLNDQQSISYGKLLPVPSVISDMIDDRIKEIFKRIVILKNDHSKYIFPDCDDEVIIKKYINSFELGDSDKVIAKKLLISNKLTPAEKYRLACRCCFENDVKRLWPSVSKNTRITGIRFEDDELLYYWNCLMREESPNIPGTNSEDSLELRMISCEYLFNGMSIEYFWDKLTPENRWSVVIDVFTRGARCENIIMSLLPKLNDITAYHVLCAKCMADQVFAALAPFRDDFEYLLRIWNYLCNFGTVDNLATVLQELIDLAFEPSHLTSDEAFQVSLVLHELWIRAPSSLRNYTLEMNIDVEMERLSSIRTIQFPDCYHRDITFLMDLLNTVDSRSKNRIVRAYLEKFIIRAKPLYLEQLLELCFENDAEMVRFKENEMMDYNELNHEFEAFVNYGYCDDLSEYIKFCSSDKIRVENLRRRIIAPHINVTTLSSSVKLTSLLKFIDDTFESTELASKFKEEMLMSSECDMLQSVYDKLDCGCLKDLINLRHFLYSESCTSMVKQECANHCKKCLIETKFVEFDINVWREFIMWCLGSRENWFAFRRSLPIDQILEELLAKVIRGFARLTGANCDQVRHFESVQPSYEILSSFTPVNNFLLWCYITKQIVGQYKVNKLKNGSSRVLRLTMSKNWGKIVDIILNWIFDDDEERMNEYKASLKPNEEAGSVR